MPGQGGGQGGQDDSRQLRTRESKSARGALETRKGRALFRYVGTVSTLVFARRIARRTGKEGSETARSTGLIVESLERVHSTIGSSFVPTAAPS